MRLEQTGSAQDLEECIDCNFRALELRPVGHPLHSSCLVKLSAAVMLCKTPNHEAVINYLLEADTPLPQFHPLQASVQRNLANVHLHQNLLREPNAQPLDTVFDLFRASSTNGAASFKNRLSFATRWAALARQHGHKSCIDAYTIALTLLNQISVMAPNLDIQRNSLHSGTTDRSRPTLQHMPSTREPREVYKSSSTQLSKYEK